MSSLRWVRQSQSNYQPPSKTFRNVHEINAAIVGANSCALSGLTRTHNRRLYKLIHACS